MNFTSLAAFTLVAAAASAPAMAGTDFDNVKLLSQSEFSKLSKDFMAAGSYKAVAPAEPLGVIGFDLGVELTSTKLDNSDVWRKAGADDSTLYLPKLHVHKGLPFKIDIGASLSAVPGSNIKLIGAEIKYAILEGGVAAPALSVRAAATRLFGVDEMDLDTRSLELTLSKGFLNITPYAGLGKVWGTVTPHVGGLRKESPTGSKVFAGINFSLGIANLAAEVDSTGGNRSASVKLGFRL